ncbi:MAG: endo-1,4-beta-xylanase, partial [Microthrixaceae bacterium]
ELRSVVTDHIQTVMTRYRGSVDRWDVVNEPLETLGSEPYDNHFRKILGVDYIAEMFAIAHKTNPEARLFLNEATVEFLPDKAAALVAMVKELLDRGEPLDGVGIQAHIVAGTIDSAVLRLLINDLEQLGVEVAITELDVPATASSDPLAVQADTYGQTLSACLEEDCREVTLWGFTDRYTWVDKAFGPGLAPLPFDRDYKPKPALAAIRERISAIPSS